MNDTSLRRKLFDMEHNLLRNISKDLKSLQVNFTKPIDSTRKVRRIRQIRSYYSPINGVDYAESDEDLDYYSQMTIEDIRTEASVLIDSLLSSKFSDEGCISIQLEPVDTIRGLRPFGGDGFILK